MKIDICFSPALYPYYQTSEARMVVMVDVFRASTTICAAFATGANAIIPVATIEETLRYKNQGWIVGAERNVEKCNFADAGNSPFEYTPEMVKGKEIVFTTTNGTQAINSASSEWEVIIGCFSNLTAVTNFCLANKKEVLVLCAGWNNRFNLEDAVFGGALAERLIKEGNFEPCSDAVITAQSLWQLAGNDPENFLKNTEHAHRLFSHHLEADYYFCLQTDTTDVLPYYDKTSKKLLIKK